MARQESYARKREDHEAFDSRRNPYLAEYEELRSPHGTPGNRAGRADRNRYTRPASARSAGSGDRVRPQAGRIPSDRGISQVSRIPTGSGSSRVSRASTGSGSSRVSRASTGSGSSRVSRIPPDSDGFRVSRASTDSPVSRRYLAETGEPMADRLFLYEEEEDLSLLYDGMPDREGGGQRTGNGTKPNSRARYGKAARRQVYDYEAYGNRRDARGQVSDREETPFRRTGRLEKAPAGGSRREAPSRCQMPLMAERTAGWQQSRGIGARSTARYGRTAGHTRSGRRNRVFRKRLMVSVWLLCILALGVAFMVRNYPVAAGNGEKEGGGMLSAMGGAFSMGQNSGALVQGIPEKVFARHPRWEENFLTPNEYSRPGDALETVTNVFVHYTANPGTSAAQNRSYFEQQKDTHEVSVSSHFIIGYDGEIIQCVPLDEIAYAVMTRNYDSISIECCYLEKDGSFTQETYDSLIALLAWLMEAYHLDSEDILRHYDCGGKKCPLYYTEHPDAWEQLKKDVDKL